MHPDLGGGFGPGYKVIGGYDFINNDSDPMDDEGHGTHVAGIVAANGTLRGVAPGALLYAYKVLDQTGTGWSSDLMTAIEYTADPDSNGVFSDHLDVVNISLGSSPSEEDPVVDAVEAAISLGVTYCISAGNSGDDNETIGSPGVSPSAITVGAVDSLGHVARFSSRGPASFSYIPKPDVVAPGVDIFSTFLNNEYQRNSGTSMACPMVAGACALLKKLHPEWGPAELKSALKLSARDLNQDILAQGSGIIDVYKAASIGTVVDRVYMNFGFDTLADDRVWVQKDSIIIRNISGEIKNYTLSAGELEDGVNFLLPDPFTLEPGETETLRFSIEVTNANLADTSGTEGLFHRGKILLDDGSSELELGWFFIRAFIMYLDYTSWPLDIIHIFNESELFSSPLRNSTPTQMLFKPDIYYVIAELSDTSAYKSWNRYTLIKEIDLNKNQHISFDKSEAKNMIIFDTEDIDGLSFSPQLAKKRTALFELQGAFLYASTRFTENLEERGTYRNTSFGYMKGMKYINSEWYTRFNQEDDFRLMDTLFYSDLPEGTLLHLAEARRKYDNIYHYSFVEKGPYEIFPDTLTLKGSAENYSTLYFENNSPGEPTNWMPKMFYNNTERPYDDANWSTQSDDEIGSYYALSMLSGTNQARNLYLYFSLQRSSKYSSAPVQLINGEFVIGNGPTAGGLYFNPGDTVPNSIAPLAAGILSQIQEPYLVFNTILHGGMREEISQFEAVGQIFNEGGELLDAANWVGIENIPGKYTVKFEINTGQKLYNAPIQNTLEAWIDSNLEDSDAPVLRYLSIRTPEGKPITYVPKNDSVRVYLTISSEERYFGYERSGLPVPFDSVRLAARLHNADEWTELDIDSVGYDSREGITCTTMFKATAYDSAHIDLQITAVDFSGNRSRTLVSPALFVKNIQTPLANDDSYDCKPGRTYYSSSSILNNDVDPFGDPTKLKITITSEPEHGELIAKQKGSFTYIPEADFEGIDHFTYSVKNELYASSSATVTLDLSPEGLLGIPQEPKPNVWIYPNPTNGEVIIGLTQSNRSDVRISVFNLSGQQLAEIFSGELGEGTHEINCNLQKTQASKIQAGIYLVEIRSTEINEMVRLIIQ